MLLLVLGWHLLRGAGGPDATLLPGIYGTGTWEACRMLTAFGVEVAASGAVAFSVRQSIVLNEGFEVPTDATFIATIERTADWSP